MVGVVLLCAAEPSLRTVAFGPTLVGFEDAYFAEPPSILFSSLLTGSPRASGLLGVGSICERLIFVPSFHSMVSGAQSSSSSSMSAHLASFPSPSS